MSGTPPIRHRLVFFYLPDRSTDPKPFEPDTAVPIDDEMDKKVERIDARASLICEGGALDSAKTMERRLADDPT